MRFSFPAGAENYGPSGLERVSPLTGTTVVGGGPRLPGFATLRAMPIPTAGRILAIDWGEIRLGLALSDERQILASPLGTLSRRAGKRFPMPAFLDAVSAHGPVGIVVGLPLTMEGEEGDSARAARELAEQVGKRAELPVELTDERMTTARVLGTIREQGGSTRGRKDDVDAHAAAVLLQGFLDRRRGGAT